ncbi:MAG TPA: GNAT family protein [Lachnospiraceae bacterium]|nr:GNAT family protein [Lachnospiraceae bacterium]
MYCKENNLALRNATIEDTKLFFQWWNDGEVMAHAGFPLGLGISSEQIVEDLARDNDSSGRRLILEVDGIAVGEMNYSNIGNQTAEIGIKICNPEYQEKGYGKHFLRMIIHSLFFELGYEKIILDTNLKNLRAQHVYESIGFRKVAVHIDAWKDQLGEPQSTIDYELKRNEI